MEQIILNKPNPDFNAMEYIEDLQPLSHYSIQSDIALKNPNKILHIQQKAIAGFLICYSTMPLSVMEPGILQMVKEAARTATIGD
jgi:hypothetical protein